MAEQFIKIITPNTPVLTKEQWLNIDVNGMRNNGGRILNQLERFANESLATVWSNENYTAQEFLTKLGTEAGSAMIQHAQLIGFLASQGIIINTSMVKAFVVNSDGTVTVSA